MIRALWLLLLWVASPALASTVAVLPLDPATPDESLQGLGRGLAAMLVTDLGTAGVPLVERDRIDTVLAELELGKSGFVDPKTAQALGQGVQAELVLVGTWTAVADTLRVDTRLVETGTGTVRHTAEASGPIDDFIGVEKQVAERLLEQLEVELAPGDRRRLMLEAPTESFGAFSAWSEGLQAEAEGRIEAAMKGFDEAARLDPAFQAALESSASLRASLSAEQTNRSNTALDALQASRDALLNATVDERKRPAGFVHDNTSHAALALRLSALADTEQWCRLQSELEAYLERVDYRVERPRGAPNFSTELRNLAAQHQLEPAPRDVGAHPIATLSISDRGDVFDSTEAAVLGILEHRPREHALNLMAAIRACHPLDKQLSEIDRIRARLDKASRAQQKGDNDLYTLDEKLVWFWAHRHAWERGSSRPLEQRLQQMLDRRTDPDERKRVSQDIRRISIIIEHWERDHFMMVGLDEDQVVQGLKVMASGEGWQDRPGCGPLRRSQGQWAERFLQETYPERNESFDHPTYNSSLGMRAASVATARRLGCLPGTAPLFGSVEELLGWARTLHQHKREGGADSCPALGSSFLAIIDPRSNAMNLGSEQARDHAHFTITSNAMGLAAQGCVTLP